MSGGLGFNKIAGATLATLLAIFGLNEASGMYFAPHEVEKPGYAVDPVEDAGPANAAAEVAPDWGSVLPTADAAAGQAVFAKCKSCHKVTAENGTGPGLLGVLGRTTATQAGFTKYSPAMLEHAKTAPLWDYDHLDQFLKAPKKLVPGTKMGFGGLKKQQDRINLIAYLRTQGGTLPVPASDPARIAAAAAAASGAPVVGVAAEGQPTATGSTAQAGQPAQAPTTGAAAAPTQVPQAKGADVPAAPPAKTAAVAAPKAAH